MGLQCGDMHEVDCCDENDVGPVLQHLSSEW